MTWSVLCQGPGSSSWFELVVEQYGVVRNSYTFTIGALVDDVNLYVVDRKRHFRRSVVDTRQVQMVLIARRVRPMCSPCAGSHVDQHLRRHRANEMHQQTQLAALPSIFSTALVATTLRGL